MKDPSNKRDREPLGTIPTKPFIVGMSALMAAGVYLGHNIVESAPEPTSSLEEVQKELGVEPKSAEMPAGVADMPDAAKLPNVDLENTVAVQLPVEKS